MLSGMDDGRRWRWEGGIWLIKEAILTPPLSSHYWHLKARIHISSKLWCCVQMWGCVSRECFHQQNSDGRKWAGDTQLTMICWKVSSADVLLLHQHLLLSIGFLLFCPTLKRDWYFILLFFQKDETNEWKKRKKKFCSGWDWLLCGEDEWGLGWH